MKTATEIQQDQKRINKRVDQKVTALKVDAVLGAIQESELMKAADPEGSAAVIAQVMQEDVLQAAKQQVEDLASELDKEIAWSHRFYSLKRKRTDIEITFDIVKILEILQELGFYRYDDETNGGQSVYVQIHDGKIRQIHDTKVIRDAFVDYILALQDYTHKAGEDSGDDVLTDYTVTPTMIYRKLLGSINYYLGEDKLERLRPDEPIQIMHDTYSTKYFYFRNCIVQITPDATLSFEYKDLNKYVSLAEERYGEKNGRYIWESSILDRDFDEKIDYIGGDFARFCSLVCGWTKNCMYEGKERDLYNKRIDSLRSILGYLMHGDFECNLKAVLFMDVNLNGDGRANGGTGKGILGKALNYAMNRKESDRRFITEAGKNFRPDDERRYSNGDLSTQLIYIEDLKKGFDFEAFYNDVTEYVPIRKMNVDRINIRSKIMLSSNTPIDVITTGNSTRRRLVIFELNNYFNAQHTPEDEFGRWLFGSKWTVDDWKMFDAFMIDCVSTYIVNKDKRNANGRLVGILEPPQINYKRQLLEAKLNTEFIDWFATQLDPILKENKISYAIEKKALYEDFCAKYEEYSNRQLYARAFCKWCKFYLEVMEIPSAEKRSTSDLFIINPSKVDKNITYIYR